jgi:hypothetical protein
MIFLYKLLEQWFDDYCLFSRVAILIAMNLGITLEIRMMLIVLSNAVTEIKYEE